MLFYVDDQRVDSYDFRVALTEALEQSYQQDSSEYDEFIDDTYGEFEIFGTSYYASDILKDVDPWAYNQGMTEFAEGQADVILNDFESHPDLQQIDDHWFESRADDNPLDDDDDDTKDTSDNWLSDSEEE